MKRSNFGAWIVLALVALCLAALSTDGLAREQGERKKPRKPAIVGLVAVQKDNDQIKAVTLTSKRRGEEVVYNVTLDDKGKQLGQEMDGKKVIAWGAIKADDAGQKWITVERYREATARKKKPPKEE